MTGPGETRLRQDMKAARDMGESGFDGWNIGADDYGSDSEHDFPIEPEDECELVRARYWSSTGRLGQLRPRSNTPANGGGPGLHALRLPAAQHDGALLRRDTGTQVHRAGQHGQPPQKGGRLTRKQADKLIEKDYYATCGGIQIDIMDIPRVFACRARQAGRRRLFRGTEEAIRAYVETIRKN